MKPRPLQVLIVEPDLSLSFQYQLELLAGGHAANIVHSGEDGLAVITPRYDLVITDLRLPAMSGEVFVLEIRSRQDLRHIPVLVIATSPTLPDSLRNGLTTLRQKPFDWDHFLLFVTEAAGRGRLPH